MTLRSRVRASVFALFAALAAAFVVAPAAHAANYQPASYPPGNYPTLAVSPTVVAQCHTIKLSGANYTPGSTVTVTLQSASTVIASGVPVSSDGSWSTIAPIPTEYPLGTHTVTATDSAGRSASTDIQVVEESEGACGEIGGGGISGGGGTSQGGTTGGGLPFTGIELAAMAAAAGVLLLGGTTLVVASRRRNNGLAA